MTRLTSFGLSAFLIGGAALSFATGNTSFTVKTTIGGDGQNNGKNDITLDEIFFSAEERYQSFVGPSAVTKLTSSGGSTNTGLRVVAGKNTTVADKVMVLNDGGSLTGQEVSNSTLRNQARDAFNSRNLNWFFDSWVSDTKFSMDVKYDTALSDKIFITERGTGGSNSKFLLEALDSSGNKIGNSVQVDPKNRVNTGRNGAVWSQGKDPSALDWHQEISFYAFDVSDFGVASLSGVRISTPHVSLGSGQDIQPDFKIYGSAAPVPEPGTMILVGAGAALAAFRRRKKA
jgi:hypothetical protein